MGWLAARARYLGEDSLAVAVKLSLAGGAQQAYSFDSVFCKNIRRVAKSFFRNFV